MKQLTLLLNVCNSNDKYLEKTIESIKNQSLSRKDFEFIVYDDGSNNDTLRLVKELTSPLSNTKIYSSKENKGLAYARNRGIEKSSGKYIALLDDDDLLTENALEYSLKFFKDNPKVQYSYSKHKRIDSEDNIICNRDSFEYSPERILHYNFVGPLKSFSKEIHNKIGGFSPEILYAQDWDHILKADLLLNKNQIKKIPEFLYYYRVHDKSISTTKSELRKEFIYNFLKEHLKNRGINAEVSWGHKRKDLYNYFNWEISNK